MFRLLFFFLLVLILGALFAWVADKPGSVSVVWLGTQYETTLMVALTVLVVLVSAILFVWSILRGLINTPQALTSFFQNRRRDRGYQALSRGLIAASSGDADEARRLARESGKLLGNEPLVGLLNAQAALLEGRREDARIGFQAMLGEDNTKLVALRGLFLEAERQGEAEAARHYAVEAARLAPSLPWASSAKLKYLATDGDWEGALTALEANRAAGLIDKEKAKRQRAVLLTAMAIEEEPADPDEAMKHAREAHKLAKDLAPAAVIFARAASRTGDIRGATKVIETTWKQQPHPELGEAYVHVRSGDSVLDRLKRARKLADIRANHPEGAMLVTAAAIDAKDWELARSELEPVLTTHPSERACLLMADIEEGEHGDKGAMQVWLSRAVRAPADPAWTADGRVSETWLPVSPVTGEIDAFEWKVPVEQMGGQPLVISAEDLVLEAAESESDPEISSGADIIEVEAVDTEEAPGKSSSAGPSNGSGPDEKPIQPVEEKLAANVKSSFKEDEKPATSVIKEQDKADTPVDGTKDGDNEGEEDDPDTVKFALDRRPDDPGVDPEKAQPKKGFGLF